MSSTEFSTPTAAQAGVATGDRGASPGTAYDRSLAEPAQRLLIAAGPVFAERGFDRAPVREIAKQADVNVAAVSYYFGDKMGLYRAVIAAIRRQREARFPAPIIGEAPPDQTLYRLIRTLLSRMLAGDEKGWEAQLMMREMQHPTEALEEMVREYFKPLYDALCQTINELLPEPNGVPDQDSASGPDHWRTEAFVPQMVFGIVGQCLYFRIGRPVMDQLIAPEIRSRHYDVESLCKHITATTLAACGHRGVAEIREELNSPNTLWSRGAAFNASTSATQTSATQTSEHNTSNPTKDGR